MKDWNIKEFIEKREKLGLHPFDVKEYCTSGDPEGMPNEFWAEGKCFICSYDAWEYLFSRREAKQ